MLVACVLCNDAILQHENNEWRILGDPTEGALIVLAGKGGVDHEPLSRKMPRKQEFPFSSERKRMSVICENNPELTAQNSPYLMFTKGSPELILERCNSYQVGEGHKRSHNSNATRFWSKIIRWRLRDCGCWVFPTNRLDTIPARKGQMKPQSDDLIWLGLVGMLDAPRPEVREAVRKCREAGIRPIMITGDHQLTAQAIAQDLGIAQAGDRVLNGQQLERLSQEELEQQVDEVSIYARVSPEHKLRIVQALQSRGKFTAMTGRWC
jgi:Ca2+-transporting ATPase